MNLYLLLVIAFGAISGVTEAPVARPGYANVAAQRGERAAERAIRTTVRALQSSRSRTSVARLAPRTQARIDAPLAGAATPRAPATNC